jgi:hypothetical protein
MSDFRIAWANRKRRHELQKEISQIERQYAQRLSTAVGKEVNQITQEKWRAMGDRRLELEALETDRLVRKARRHRVLIPKDKDWWWYDGENIQGTSLDDMWESPFLTETRKVGAEKLISEARFTNVKRWIELFIPILSLLIALIALLKR